MIGTKVGIKKLACRKQKALRWKGFSLFFQVAILGVVIHILVGFAGFPVTCLGIFRRPDLIAVAFFTGYGICANAHVPFFGSKTKAVVSFSAAFAGALSARSV